MHFTPHKAIPHIFLHLWCHTLKLMLYLSIVQFKGKDCYTFVRFLRMSLLSGQFWAF